MLVAKKNLKKINSSDIMLRRKGCGNEEKNEKAMENMQR